MYERLQQGYGLDVSLPRANLKGVLLIFALYSFTYIITFP